MKNLLIAIVFMLCCNFILAQENLFEKTSANFVSTKSATEKLNRFESREAIKQWEQLVLQPNIVLSKNYKGIFNIFDKSLEFEVIEDYGIDVNGVQGYKAELREGGYAILSSSANGIGAAIWYKDTFYNVEVVENRIYFASEVDLSEIAKKENPNDYGNAKELYKTDHQTSVSSVLSTETIKVFVAYTPPVAQNYNITQLVNGCISTTIGAYNKSLVSTRVELAGSAQLTYTESGDAYTDVTRFMNMNDGYLDQIHSLRKSYEADVCVLLVNTLNLSGRVPDGSIGASYNNAFFVVKAEAAVSNYSFPHELAHLFGCRHDSDPGTYPYSYAHGFN